MSDTNAILILGATSGIGGCLARRLTEAGRRVVVSGRDKGRLSELAKELDVRSVRLESGSFDAIANAVEGVDGLSAAVNCAGSILIRPAHLTTENDFEETLNANVRTAFATVRAAAKRLAKSGGGSIVLMSSCAASVGLANHEAISAAKGAVEGLTRSAAATYAPQNVRINAVAPGLTRTSGSRRITENAAALKASTAMHPLGRIGEPDDIVSAIMWLLDDASSWVTGQVIGVDGGLAAARPRERGD